MSTTTSLAQSLRRARDAGISPAAFLLYTSMLLDTPEGWTRCEDLGAATQLSSHAVRQRARELRAAGFLDRRRQPERNATGEWTSRVYYRPTTETEAR